MISREAHAERKASIEKEAAKQKPVDAYWQRLAGVGIIFSTCLAFFVALIALFAAGGCVIIALRFFAAQLSRGF